MNLENVKALADVLCAKGLSAIEVGEGVNRIRIEKEIFGASTPTVKIPNQRVEVSAESEIAAPLSAPQATTDATFAAKKGSSVNVSKKVCVHSQF